MRGFSIFATTVLVVVAISIAGVSAVWGRDIPAHRVQTPPVMDGVLDEACWQREPDASDFFSRVTGEPTLQTTHVWICYDDANIYAAFRCFDDEPHKIVAQQRKRGGSISKDDFVSVEIDCQHAHQDMMRFSVTPRGTQNESFPARGGTKIEWIGDWFAAAKVDADGWSAEMTIPFSLLRYPPNQETMGVCFSRQQASSAQTTVSPDMGPNWDISLTHHWTGLKPPPPLLERVILHYANIATSGTGLRNGADMRQQLSSQTSALLTIKPDFQSVEQDIESIDFTYEPRTLSDRRPFFQEGQSSFRSENYMFYSRNVADVSFGAKVIGDNPIRPFQGIIVENGDERHAFWKARFYLDDQNYFGLAAANSRLPGMSNDTGSLYWRLRRVTPQRTDRFQGSIFKSWTPGDGGEGMAMSFRLRGDGARRQPGYNLEYTDIRPDYQTYLGKIDYPDIAGWRYSLGYGDQNDERRVRGWYTEVFGNTHRFHDGRLLQNGLGTSYSGRTRTAWWQLGISAESRSHEGIVYDDSTAMAAFGWRSDDIERQGDMRVISGRRLGGDYQFVGISQNVPVGQLLNLRLSVEHSSLAARDPFRIFHYIVYAGRDFSDERSVGLRLVARSGKTNLTANFRQAVRKGLDIFVLYGDPAADRTQNRLIVKLVRPLLL